MIYSARSGPGLLLSEESEFSDPSGRAEERFLLLSFVGIQPHDLAEEACVGIAAGCRSDTGVVQPPTGG